MPSPLGHALAAATAGCAIYAPSPGAPRTTWLRHVLLFSALGLLPDLDLLTGGHRGPTHSLGAAAAVGLVGLALSSRIRFAAAAAAAYATHTLLDWLGSDTSAPVGIMALWPLTTAYYESGLHVFHAISRRYWLPGFLDQNLRAIARELLILGPIAGLVLALRLRGGRQSSG